MRKIVDWQAPSVTVKGELGRFRFTLRSECDPHLCYMLSMEKTGETGGLYWHEQIEGCESLDDAMEEAERRVSAMLSDWQEALDRVAFGWVREAVNG